MRRLVLAIALGLLIPWMALGVGTIGFLPSSSSPDTAFEDDAGFTTGGEVFSANMHWIIPDLDDAAGVANGNGADPNPYPGDWAASVWSGMLESASNSGSSWMMNPIHTMSSFNLRGQSDYNDDLYSSSDNYEYGYDVGQHSGAQQVEHYWQFIPSTHLITFGAGSGTSSIGDNITFSNGAVCRAAQGNPAVTVAGGSIHMNCVNHTPPVATNTITACTGESGACTETGTVASVVDDKVFPWRPFFFELFTSNNKVNLQLERGPSVITSGTPSTLKYWLSAQDGVNTVFIGKGNFSDAAVDQARVSLPAVVDVAGTGLGYGAGVVAVDTSLAGQVPTGGTGRFIWSEAESPTFYQWPNSPIQHYCYQYTDADGTTDLDAADTNRNVPFAPSYPWILWGLACRNDVSTAPATAATITVETLAGAAITLGGTVTCAGSASAMTYQTMAATSNSSGMHPADTDAVLAVGAGVRIDVTNTPNPATDAHTICIAYTPQSS